MYQLHIFIVRYVAVTKFKLWFTVFPFLSHILLMLLQPLSISVISVFLPSYCPRFVIISTYERSVLRHTNALSM